ncbi:hypothetical protein Pst134EB_004268 [Puccinia striiformis f. sp. tritici]|nr:hypothetical protein Pst134EB_004268 [Puccinia striiformis f. sp. tritici]
MRITEVSLVAVVESEFQHSRSSSLNVPRLPFSSNIRPSTLTDIIWFPVLAIQSFSHKNNIEQRRADRDRIARLENTLFDIVTKAEEEKQERLTPPPKSTRLDLQKFRIADGPHFTGPFQSIEPFLNWIRQLQIFFSTKNVIDDDDKIYVAGGLLQETILVGFYASEGAQYAGKTWNKFRSRLFEVALPQRWRTTLKAKLRELTIGPNKSFIVLSSRARTLQSLINFDTSLSSENAVTYVSDFDLAEYVVLGVKNETIHGDIAKFALLDATPFSYSAFENRVASFDEVTIWKTTHRAPRTSPSNHAPSNSPPDPVAWRVHAYLDSQGQCHHCKTTCGSAPATRWTPPFRSTSLAAIADSSDSDQPPSNTDYVEVVEAIDSDQQTFVDAAAEEDLPPDLTAGDWATFKEIDEILSDNVANVKEDETSVCGSEYCSDLGCDPFVNTLSLP